MGKKIKIGTEDCSVQKVIKVLKESESFVLFCDVWQDFAEELEIDRLIIKELVEKRKLDQSYKIQHIVRDLLDLWVSKEGSRATLNQLCKALEAVKLVALKDRLNEVNLIPNKANTDAAQDASEIEPRQRSNKNCRSDSSIVRSVRKDNSVEDVLCPVCLLIPEAEVYMCNGGHSYSSSCYFQTTKCSECQSPLDKDDPIRNLPIEKILDRIKMECPFKSNGCKEKLSRKDVQNHTNYCCFDFDKFGDFVNLCKSIGYRNCGFKFNNGNTKDAVEHFVSKHGCILTMFKSFQMELTSFKESSIAKGSGFYFWTPIIADLKERKCYLLTMVVLNNVNASFNWLSVFLPYPNNECRGSSPVKVGYTIQTGVSSSFRVWVERPMSLKKASTILPNEIDFLNYSLSFVRRCSKEGSLLVDCHIRRQGVPVPEGIESAQSFVCARNTHSNSDGVKPEPPKVPVRLNRLSGSEAGMSLRDKLQQNCDINRYTLWPTILNIFEEEKKEGLTEEDVKWLKMELIFLTAQYGSAETMEYLIEKGVNFDIVDEDGCAPLHYTMFDYDFNIGLEKAKLLVDSGIADVHVLDDEKRNAFQYAAWYGNSEAVEYFIWKGCDVNASNRDGLTPLHCALLIRNEEEGLKMAKSLVANGADFGIKDNGGATALDLATTYGKTKIAELLRSPQSNI